MAENRTPLTDSPRVARTPTPWRIADIVGGESLSVVDQAILIRDEQTDNWVAAVTTDGTISRMAARANAEFTVRAVNCHQDLLDACKDIEKTAKHFAGFHSSAYLNAEKYRSDSWNAMLESILKIQAAIKKAESGG